MNWREPNTYQGSTTNETQLWTTVSPVLSTGHLKQQTMKTLDLYRNLIAQYDHGCFVYLGTKDEEAADEVGTWPEDLRIVAAWLWEQPGDLAWIRFDSDGDVIDGLPKYKW